MTWDLHGVRTALVLVYAAVGGGLLLIQSLRRLGIGGVTVLAPLAAVGGMTVATRHTVSPFPWDVFAGALGGLCLAIVLVTRGRIERFVDPSVLPERLRSGTEDDAMAVQTKAIGLALVMWVPLFVVFSFD